MSHEIQTILKTLQDKITECGFELMQRYPNDLLVHDRAALEMHAHHGAQIAWCVGHSHTHMAVLGVHPEENKCVTYYTNLENADRFFLLNVRGASITLSEKTRSEFRRLAETFIPYSKSGSSGDFWLYNNAKKIGHVRAFREGPTQSAPFRVAITPISGIDARDRGALALWGGRAVVEISQSLFTRIVVDWQPDIATARAA